MCIDSLTEDNNRNFARGSPTELFLFISLVSLVNGIGLPLYKQVVSVTLTEYNNRNFARGSPTEIFLIFNCFSERDISSAN